MGNKNSGRRQDERPFRDALVLELELAAGDKSKLRKVARSLVKKATEGDIQAMKEIADRVDGKPAQAIQHSGDFTDEVVVLPTLELAKAAALLLSEGIEEQEETRH